MKKVILVLIGILFVAGCSRMEHPSPEVMKSEIGEYKLPHKAKEGKAIVYILREESAQSFEKFYVYLDSVKPENKMGYTHGAQYIYFYVTPGQHTIFSDAERIKSIDIQAKAGDVIFIEQEVVMGYIIAYEILHNDYDLLTGTYLLKSLSLGTVIKTQK